MTALSTAILIAGGCALDRGAVAAERAANKHSLDTKRPADAAVIVTENGATRAVASLAEAWKSKPSRLHRFVFLPGEEGNRRLRMAYMPASGAVAGPKLLDALGVRVATRDDRTFTLGRDLRTVQAGQGQLLTLSVGPPGAVSATTIEVAYDPEFDGTLVVPTAVANSLRLFASEVPGDVDVHVALGRPFVGRRLRAEVGVPAIGAQGTVEVVTPRGGVR